MLQVRFHGRGGQGVVTAAELLSVAAFLEGRHALAFPSFGSERMGAPVVSYCRIDSRRIATYEPVESPDAIVVSDPTLLHVVDVTDGLPAGGLIVLNTSRSIGEVGLGAYDGAVVALPATEVAMREIGRPLPNAALLGALAAACSQTTLTWAGRGLLSLRAVELALEQRFLPAVATSNIRVARRGFELARERWGSEVPDAWRAGSGA